ncbi:MAG TPA: hypothetical protein VFB72_20875 [Verrucomicrobiae bacterium]|nr:hypothetical protein [Verrucomicrobiae bacterium]
MVRNAAFGNAPRVFGRPGCRLLPAKQQKKTGKCHERHTQTRCDSTWNKLNPEQKTILHGWLFDQNLGYNKVLELAQKEGGFSDSRIERIKREIFGCELNYIIRPEPA